MEQTAKSRSTTFLFIANDSCKLLINSSTNLINFLRSTLGERNPNPELDGLPVLY